MRKLASSVGIREASLYNHFPSKKAILEYILEYYTQRMHGFFVDNLSALKEAPTVDNIMSCLTIYFPEDEAKNFFQRLCVILQEQYRNPTVREYVSESIILTSEQVVKRIVNTLKEANILRQDTDPDFWAKMHSSLVYSFACRALLGIGDTWPGFTGLNMVEMMRSMYDTMLKSCCVKPEDRMTPKEIRKQKKKIKS